MPNQGGDWERVATVGIACGLIAIGALVTGSVLISLSDANIASFGHWFDAHGADIWKAGAAAATAAATFLFGHRRGRSMGTSDTEIADAAAAEGLTGDQAAKVIREKARARRRRSP